MEAHADKYRDLLTQFYGPDAAGIRYAEAFEPCEYGTPLTDETIPRLFPFLPR